MLEIINEHKGFFKQIFMLAKNELVKAYKGTLVGSAWAVVKPLSTLFVFWFTFEIGIRKNGKVHGFPQFIFMLVGFIPWFFISDSIIGGARSIRKNAQFVTKLSFPVSTIMTFTALSRFYVHILIVFLMYIYLILMGYCPSIYNIQIFYYAPLMFVFFLSLSWITAPLSVFSKDFENTVNSFITGIFWLSGIVWDTEAISIKWLKWLLKFNPVNYFITGYRKTFIYNEWFFLNKTETLVLFIEIIIIIILGSSCYTKLRKTMSDVL